MVDFSVDEHPRRDTTAEKLAQLKGAAPRIEGFSITAGNSSGTNDACAAVAVVEQGHASEPRPRCHGDGQAWARSVFRRATPVWEVSR